MVPPTLTRGFPAANPVMYMSLTNHSSPWRLHIACWARACPLKFLLWWRWVDESSRSGKLGVLVIWFQAFQILQSDVSEVVAPIEFVDQCISPAISPRLTKVDTHGKTQFLPSSASSHTNCMQASLGANCPRSTHACTCPLPLFTSQTKLTSSLVSYIPK